ncbi:hypothetical protein GUJ93_ZPchr0006g42853 [Zizania palustris]|uniref:Uncharacterized protein n=1 Tax=Zizania palustris TaxID=103762 RepID=A0A8J5VQN5_ZIZPA|nr:hypothetical protein GUJ93_ZPchr0006g42853 [Zizania palustris]
MVPGGVPNAAAIADDPPVHDLDDEPMVDTDQWEPWPEHQNNVPQIVQLPDELSIQASAVSIPPNSGSSSHSAMNEGVQEISSPKAPLSGPNPKPHTWLVYKRRQQAIIPRADLLAINNSVVRHSVSVLAASGLRRSARIKEKLLGFRTALNSRQKLYIPMQGSDSMARNEDGLQLPPQPTIQDFAQATSAGMIHAPLSIEQIQHSAIHYCGIPTEHVTVDKLSAAEPGSSHTTAAPQND